MFLLPTPLQLQLARRVQTADDEHFPELQRGVAKLISGPPLPPPPQVSPKAAAKRPPPPPPKGGAKAPGPAPPPRRREPPKWRGPAASKDWKTAKLISWNPIRQASRLEASVWRGVSLSEIAPEVPDGLLDGLNAAFMSKASAEPAPRLFSRQSARRLLSRRQALQADILHAKLARCGIQNPAQLAWITNAGELPVTAQDEQGAARAYVRRRVRLCALRRWRCGTRPLSGEVLEALLGLLGLLEEDPAMFEAGPAQAPAEVFMQQLLGCVADVRVLRSHVRAALHIARFQDASSVEVVLLHGLAAARVVLKSRALPVLLQGMLVAGNYVNSFSSLGGALGITLDSIAKFAQTRCKQGSQYANALVLVVQHLQGDHPDLVQGLTEDLDHCRSVQGLDARALEEMVEGLESQVEFVRSLARDAPSQGGPDALAPERLREFLGVADPQVSRLAKHLRDLQAATRELRAWFAEPPETPLVAMLNSLAQLRDALPAAAKPPRAAASARGAPRAHDAASRPQRAAASARGQPWRPAVTGSLPGQQPERSEEEAAPAAGWRTAVTAPAPSLEEPQPQHEPQPQPQPPPGPGPSASETSSEDTISTPGTDGEARFEEDLSALTSALEGLAPGACAASPDATAASAADFEGTVANLSLLLEGMAASRGRGEPPPEPAGFGGGLEDADFEEPLSELHSALRGMERQDADFEEPLSELHSALRGMALSKAWSSVLPGDPRSELDEAEGAFEAPLAELAAALARARGQPPDRCFDEGAFAQPLADLENVVARLAAPPAGDDAPPPTDAAANGEESEALREFLVPLGNLETALAVLGSRINAHS